MPFDIAKLQATEDEMRIISKHFLSKEKKASIVRENGEAWAGAYEASYNESVAEAMLPAMRMGAADERERWRQVLDSREAKGKRQAAIVLLGETGMEAPQIRQILGALKADDGVLARMDAREPLVLDAEAPQQHAQQSGGGGWDDIAASLNAGLPARVCIPGLQGGQTDGGDR
ncbi:MAG: hypothetical protein K2X71_18970 [Methylobacterium sp.]|uniref:hypothetical protein n=1 Tax=Methylobacterium sp. TaxID=409 RepID=UPI002583052C|nr:hypothetical protein [Methylobacterium sp.]MBY0298084.1 hypothetical protein [Methylobacterium sp.]